MLHNNLYADSQKRFTLGKWIAARQAHVVYGEYVAMGNRQIGVEFLAEGHGAQEGLEPVTFQLLLDQRFYPSWYA